MELKKELLKLVESGAFTLEEMQVVQALRDGVIENPLKDVEEKESIVNNVKEINETITSGVNAINTCNNLIQKVEKTIEIFTESNSLLFPSQELLSKEDQENLSFINEDFKSKLVSHTKELKGSIVSLNSVKTDIDAYSSDVSSLFNNSYEINSKIQDDFLESMNNKSLQPNRST